MDCRGVRNFLVHGAISPVLRCACTPSDLVEVPLRGFGVGAGGIGTDAADALQAVGDATFLFGSVIVSKLPMTPQRDGNAGQLRSSGLRYYAPIMAQFWGGEPDLTVGRQAPVTQRVFLEETVLPAFPEARAVGCLALVRIKRADVAGALIAASVIMGATRVPFGHNTTDPEIRADYFDLDPLRHRTGFEEGYGWVVSTCVRNQNCDSRDSDLIRRFTGGGSHSPWLTHTHIVLVSTAPDSWLQNAQIPWSELETSATDTIISDVGDSFALHSDNLTSFEPMKTVAWGYRDPIGATGTTSGKAP